MTRAVVRREEVGLALLLLVVASSLPATAEAFHIDRAIEQIASIPKGWFLELSNMLSQIAHFVEHPLKTKADMVKWVTRAVKTHWWDRNPYVRCVKVAWPRCLAFFMGWTVLSCSICPIVAYGSCISSWKLGRKSYDGPNPNMPPEDSGD